MNKISLVFFVGLSLGLNGCGAGGSVQKVASENSSLGEVVGPGQPSTPGQPGAPSSSGGIGVALPGVNIGAGSYNKVGARYGYDYLYPTKQEIEYFASKGMKLIRMPLSANTLQPLRYGELSAVEMGRIDTVVSLAKAKGIRVLLDPHNYGSLRDNDGVSRLLGIDPLMPASALADFWAKVAEHYLSEPSVIFGLMNEPHKQNAVQWRDIALESIKAIRATGSKNMISIPGTSWTGAHSWVGSGNAAAWDGFTDINFVYELHQYLDSDSSGTHDTCIAGVGAKRFASVTNWLRAQKAKAILGEIGWTTNQGCMTEGEASMQYLAQNRDVWAGYTYWSAGAWWGDYMFTIEPEGLNTSTVKDRAQMSILRKWMN